MADSPQLPHTHDARLEKAAARLPDTNDFREASDIFKLLGDASRLKIFWLLCHGEECVINIAALMGMSSPSVAHHLKILKMSGLIESRREGKEVFYRADMTKARVVTLHSFVEKLMRICCLQN